MRSVCRQRNAGIWRASATPAVAGICDVSWTSVRMGRAVVVRRWERRGREERPGPRGERWEVRLALSKDALKSRGRERRAVMARRALARERVWGWGRRVFGPAIRRIGELMVEVRWEENRVEERRGKRVAIGGTAGGIAMTRGSDYPAGRLPGNDDTVAPARGSEY